MRLQDALNSRAGIALGLSLSRALPQRLGFKVATWLADRITANKENAMVRAVRANQWVIHDQKATAGELDCLVRETFRNTARSLYEFWHFFHRTKLIMDLVEFDPSFERCFHEARSEKRGTLFVVPHMTNFDLVGRAVVLRGLYLHILSYPQPPGGYRWQNHLRLLPGLTVTPMSIQALRQASQTLRDNRTVLTGVDRPLPEGEDAKYRPRFFGRPAATPVFHIRLALKHDLPITVLGACREPNGIYRLWASDPIPMTRSSDLIQEIVQNAENVLSVIATYIRKAPEQWAMFYPAWPEILEEAP